jgi:hypothetical protein
MSNSSAGKELRLRRLVYAQRAFKNVIAMVEFALTQDLANDPAWFDVAFTGICAEYMRPFLRSDGIGPLPPEYTKFEDPRLSQLHESLAKGRHWLFAHHDAINAPSLLAPEEVATYKRVIIRIKSGKNVECATIPPRFVKQNLPQIVEIATLQKQRTKKEMEEALYALLVRGKTYKEGEYVLGESFP